MLYQGFPPQSASPSDLPPCQGLLQTTGMLPLHKHGHDVHYTHSSKKKMLKVISMINMVSKHRSFLFTYANLETFCSQFSFLLFKHL